MAFATVFLLLAYASLIASDFITLDCPQENHGVYGQKSVLVCVVRPVSGREVTIETVVWKKNNDPLLVFHGGKYTQNKTDVTFAEQAWNTKNMDVSLMLSNTKMTDEGDYECLVITDMGHVKVKTSLSVTAKYKPPTMNSIPENIMEGTDFTMFCNSTGGDQVGSIKWYDDIGSDWTRSAQLVSQKTKDGLFSLSSKFTVLGSSTSYSRIYRCSVYNAKEVQEGESKLELQFRSGQEGPGDPNLSTKFVAPLVVIGSLVVGLLLTLLVCRRRSQRLQHQPVNADDMEHHSVKADDMERQA